MKFFNRRSSNLNCFCNLCVSLLCTSCLFTGYYNHGIDIDIHHDKTAKVIQNDMEAVSQLGKKSNKLTKVTTVVTKNDVNSSNKKYTPAKYNEVTGSAIVDYAKKYLGLRYVSGGNSLETGTDCSGFTKLIYKEFGVTLSRTVKTQVNNGSYIKKSDLQKGDLVFYGYGDNVVRHVAIYIGNGQVIHESNRRDGVKISSLNMMEYITSRRVVNATADKIVAEKQENSIDKNEESVYNDNSDVVVDDSSNVNDSSTKDSVSSSETIDNQTPTENNTDSVVGENSNVTGDTVTDTPISNEDNNVYTNGEY